MSRVGKEPIVIPDKVQIKVKNNTVTVKGPKGELQRDLPESISAKVEDDKLIVEREKEEKKYRSLHGLTRSLLSNMVYGVKKGYMKKLFVVGTGYKVEIQNKWLILSVGFSHDVYFRIPDAIEVKTEKVSRAAASDIPELQAIIDLMSYDKELLGNVTASIRNVRPPGAFNKCKGIRYSDEKVKKKPGKIAGGGEAV